MSNVSLMKCLLSQILENITELLPVTRVKTGFYHHSNFVYRHFWPSPWSDGERTQSPYTDVVHRDFFIFIFLKIKISKIYVRFEIFQKYPR